MLCYFNCYPQDQKCILLMDFFFFLVLFTIDGYVINQYDYSFLNIFDLEIRCSTWLFWSNRAVFLLFLSPFTTSFNIILGMHLAEEQKGFLYFYLPGNFDFFPFWCRCSSKYVLKSSFFHHSIYWNCIIYCFTWNI